MPRSFIFLIFLTCVLTGCGTTKEDWCTNNCLPHYEDGDYATDELLPRTPRLEALTLTESAPTSFTLPMAQVYLQGRVKESARIDLRTEDLDLVATYRSRGNMLARIPGFDRVVQLPKQVGWWKRIPGPNKLFCSIRAGTEKFPSPIFEYCRLIIPKRRPS